MTLRQATKPSAVAVAVRSITKPANYNAAADCDADLVVAMGNIAAVLVLWHRWRACCM